MTEQGLCKEERLHSLRRIGNLFACGESGFAYPYRYIWTVYEPGSERLPAGCRVDPAGGSAGRKRGRGSAPQPRPVDVECGVSVMVTVPKRNHKRANKRNLLRRRTKEALRLNKAELSHSAAARGKAVDIAFIVAVKDLFDYKTAEHGVRKILETIGKAL